MLAGLQDTDRRSWGRSLVGDDVAGKARSLPTAGESVWICVGLVRWTGITAGDGLGRYHLMMRSGVVFLSVLVVSSGCALWGSENVSLLGWVVLVATLLSVVVEDPVDTFGPPLAAIGLWLLWVMVMLLFGGWAAVAFIVVGWIAAVVWEKYRPHERRHD